MLFCSAKKKVRFESFCISTSYNDFKGAVMVFSVAVSHLGRSIYQPPHASDFIETLTTQRADAHSVYSYTSGPVGAGRLPLRLRTPHPETEFELVYDRPILDHSDLHFFRATTNLSVLGSEQNREGLARLNISGSGSLHSSQQINKLKAEANGRPVHIIDLRQESHAIINGHPVTWRGRRDWVNIKGSRLVIF